MKQTFFLSDMSGHDPPVRYAVKLGVNFALVNAGMAFRALRE